MQPRYSLEPVSRLGVTDLIKINYAHQAVLKHALEVLESLELDVNPKGSSLPAEHVTSSSELQLAPTDVL